MTLSKYTWIGVGMGFCFPIMALWIDMAFRDLHFTSADILKAHLTNPIHFIIDSAPVILGLVFYLMGRVAKKSEKELVLVLELDNKKLNEIKEYIELLSKGNYGTPFEGSEQYKELMNNFRMELQSERKKDLEASWLNEKLLDLSDILNLSGDIKAYINRLLSFIAKQIDASYIGFYLVEEDKLILLDVYSGNEIKSKGTYWEKGEGFAGQCWLDGEKKHYNELPESKGFYVESSLGKANLKELLLLPLKKSNGEVVGIIEFGFLVNTDRLKLTFLDRVVENLIYRIV